MTRDSHGSADSSSVRAVPTHKRRRARKAKHRSKRRTTPQSRQDAPRRFRKNKRVVRYAGLRWRLAEDRGRWLFVARNEGLTTHMAQWIPAACAK
jgi:hypothetical protein